MTTIQPTEDRLSTLAEGVWVDGRYLSRADAHQCVRCGLWRRVDKRRTQTELCQDCRTIEIPSKDLTKWLNRQPVDQPTGTPVRDAKGIVRWVQPERLTPADRAWCEHQADVHFWTRWETDNRVGTVTETTIREAIRRTETMQQPTRKVA